MIITRSDPKKRLNIDIETNFYWATSNKRCCSRIKHYYVIQKPLTALDFIIESLVYVMQHMLIKDNPQGT